MPGIVLGAGHTAVKEQDKNLCPPGTWLLSSCTGVCLFVSGVELYQKLSWGELDMAEALKY